MNRHRRSSIVLLNFILCVCLMAPALAGAQNTFKPVELTSADRILIVAPHPDDEVIGCAGIIQKAKALGLPIHVVFLTYGDNNQWSFLVYRKRPVFWPKDVEKMGMVRHDEAVSATMALGLMPEQLTFLGYPDFGTIKIWYRHWGDRSAFQAMLTKARAVPYSSAFRPSAAYKGEEIVKDLKEVIGLFKPTKIFVSHPADHNGDHQAAYLFTRIALWDLQKDVQPELYPYLIHVKNWPYSKGYHPDQALQPPDVFKDIEWHVVDLTPKEVEQKETALESHLSQFKSSKKYLQSFIRNNELFGDYPELKFVGSSDVPLHDPVVLSQDMPEELTEEERAMFIGFEERIVSVKDQNLIVTIKLSKPLAETIVVSLYAFGYRYDRPFEEMPKIHIKFGELTDQVYDQNKRIDTSLVKITRDTKEISVQIPLAVLGDPQKIMTSARTNLGDVPLDWVSWRIIEIQ